MAVADWLTAAATALEVVGSISDGKSTKSQANFQAAETRRQTGLQADVIRQNAEDRANSLLQTEEMQARIIEQQAAREIEVAAASEDDYRRTQARVLAERRAALGGSGAAIDTGSPVLARSDFITEAELQAQRIRAGGQISAERLRQQAGLRRFAANEEASLLRASGNREADLLRSTGLSTATLTQAAGRSAERQGYFRAGASLLSGAGTIYST